MFGNFFIGLLALYVLYYGVMLFMDFQRMKKNQADGGGGEEVNISSAVAGYQAADAGAIIRGGMSVIPQDADESSKSVDISDVSEEPDMDRDYADEERDETATDGSLVGGAGELDLPFSVSGEFTDADSSSASGGQSVKLTPEIKTDISDDGEFVPVEHSSGLGVVEFSQLVEEAKLEESFFKGILCA